MGPCFRWLLALSCAQVCISGVAQVSAFRTAYINMTLVSPDLNRTLWPREEMGLYGMESPTYPVSGSVYLANPIHACANDTGFDRPAGSTPWIALIQRGKGCTFTHKINAAARNGAAAAVIFNDNENRVIQMSHPGTSIVAVMISYSYGLKLAAELKNGVSVSMAMEVGFQRGLWMSHYSILFISISFFIITTATVCYFIFYFGQRLNSIRQRNHKQKQMKAKAKKAIDRLKVRTLKQGDWETGPDADACAVCIDAYKPGDVISVLTCNHFFHKLCVEPWLMENRTCPMCKCDILKSLGVEVEVEEPPASTVSADFSSDDLHTHSNPESHTHTHTDAAVGPALHTHDDMKTVCVNMQSPYDNHAFENDTCS